LGEKPLNISDCVIVAAGASSRMGGAWKPLLPFGASTIIQTTVGTALSAGLRVVLVVGFRGDELARLFAHESEVLIAENPHWERGLLGSVLCGMERARGGAVFSMNADKPLVSPEAYRLVAAEYQRRIKAGMPPVPLFASYQGKAGHPVLIPREIALQAASLPPDARMRDHLKKYEPALVECGDEAVLLDIDTPEEYERLRALRERSIQGL
jgi:molybdenum cofactor cytidylyltransferase